jgi:hypothetical protein
VVLVNLKKTINFIFQKPEIMSLYLRISSSIVGLLRGENAKKKFLYLQHSKNEERRLKNFWHKKGLTGLDEVEIRSWHNN